MTKMLTDNPTWTYQGYTGPASRRMQAWDIDGVLVAVITETPDDEGTAIANVAEKIHAQLAAEYPGREVVHLEHRTPHAFSTREEYALVDCSTGRARWEDLTAEAVAELLAGIVA